MLDWLIIGGGVHGCTIAESLMRIGGVEADAITIVDPHDAPLTVWHRTTRNCGMRFLRSPAAHAIVPDFTALLRWGRRHGFDRNAHTIPPYARPSLELFNAHAQAVIERDALASRWIRDLAVSIVPSGGPSDVADRRSCSPSSWTVTGSSGTSYRARRVVLSPGRSPGLNVPSWAPSDDTEDRAGDGDADRVMHVFEERFSPALAAGADRPLIVGAGVTAAHLALFLAERGVRVRIVARHEPRVHQFDSDPCFIGPSCMDEFLAEKDPERRRMILCETRHPGSVPPELADAVATARANGTIEFVVDEITHQARVHGSLVRLTGRKGTYDTDLVVLATGFKPGPPVQRLLEAIKATVAEDRVELTVDGAGYPVPAPSLEWASGLYLSGALAELELGPSAPNIVGAHNAAKRIIASLHGTPRRVPGAWRRYAPASVSSSSDSV